MKKYIGKYLGPNKIKEIKKTDEKTYLGNEKLIVIYENDQEECFPVKMLDAGITNIESDWSELREARVKPIVEQLMTILTEAELKKSEIDYVTGPKLVESILLAFKLANEKLWGKIYDDVTMKDADKILKQK